MLLSLQESSFFYPKKLNEQYTKN